MEGLPSGTVLGTVMAKDPDEGENGTVYYSLSGECPFPLHSHCFSYHYFNFELISISVASSEGSRAERFSLNPISGELRTASPLRWAERADYVLTVTAADHGTPGLSSTCQLRIQVNTICTFSFSHPSSSCMYMHSMQHLHICCVRHIGNKGQSGAHM